MEANYNIPVLFLIFNRPDCTLTSFEAIKKVKPCKLYIAADGPRKSRPREAELCAQAREITQQIDWDCKVQTLFRTENLGCGKAVSEAITWFFANERYGIIIEDDCIPSKSFFEFCEKALLFHKDDLRVWHIDGSNFNEKNNFNEPLYSHFPLIWGWATWKNRWDKYSYDISNDNPVVINNAIDASFSSIIVRHFWKKRFRDFFKNKIDTWDYQWMLTVWKHHGLVVRPHKNLIENIGFDDNATHTTKFNEKLVNKAKELNSTFSFSQENLVVNEVNERDLFINRFMKKSKLYMYLFFLYEKIKR